MKTQNVIAISSGKGGVGKSFFATNLSCMLAEIPNKKVLIVDFDFGSANIHTYIGAQEDTYSVSDFVSRRVPHLESIVQKTQVPNLCFISGARDDFDIHNISEYILDTLISQLRTLPYDYIVLDLGAGTHNVFIDSFNRADTAILLSTPERTSIENAERFIKSAFFRRFYLAEKRGLGLGPAIQTLRSRRCASLKRGYAGILDMIASQNQFMKQKIEKELHSTEIHVVLNMVHSLHEIDKGADLARSCQEVFGIPSRLLGFIDYEPNCRSAIEDQVPLVLSQPQSHFAYQLSQIVNFIDDSPRFQEEAVQCTRSTG